LLTCHRAEQFFSIRDTADVTRVILCSRNHDLDERNPEGAKIARWVGELRELAIACDGDSLAIGDTLFFSLPVVGRAGVRQRIDEASCGHAKAKANARSEAKAMDLGAPRAASQFPDQPGRQALFPRRRARAVDRTLPAFDGDLGAMCINRPCPRRLLVRPARQHLGVQYGRQPGRLPTQIALQIDDGRVFCSATAKRSTSTSTRRCSGRPRRSPIRRRGFYFWIGSPIRFDRLRMSAIGDKSDFSFYRAIDADDPTRTSVVGRTRQSVGELGPQPTLPNCR
jgi:hypothetical protein